MFWVCYWCICGLPAGKTVKITCLSTRGDTITKLTLPVDRATRCIFGDAGIATIIEPGEQNIAFSFASYGERYNAIIMENSRHRMKENPVNEGWLYLDGVGIMNFTLNEVPGIMQEIGVCQELCVKKFSRLHHSAS